MSTGLASTQPDDHWRLECCCSNTWIRTPVDYRAFWPAWIDMSQMIKNPECFTAFRVVKTFN